MKITEKIRNARKVSIIALIFFLVYSIVYVVLSFDGYYFYDDITYSRNAYKVLNNILPIQKEIFSYRIGVFMPVSFFYMLFGVSDFSTNIYPVLCYIVCALAIFFSLYNSKPYIALIATLLFGLDYYTTFFSNRLYPDSIITVFIFFSVVIMSNNHISEIFKGIISALCLFWAFLVKETVIYIYPFFLFLLIFDIINKKNKSYWIYLLTVSMLLFLGYFFFFYINNRNILERFQVIQDGHYTTSFSYYDKDWFVILSRITYIPILMFIASDMAIVLGFALPSFFKLKDKNFYQQHQLEFLCTVASMSMLLMFWFWSTSFQFYNPIGLLPRMILPVIPFLAIMGGTNLLEYVKKNKHKNLYILWFSFCCIIAFFYINLSNKYIYMLIFLIILLKKYFNNYLFVFFVVLILFIHPTYTAIKKTDTGYSQEKYLMQYIKNNIHTPSVIIIDEQLYNGYDFYFDYQVPKYLHFKPYNSLLENKLDQKMPEYLLINTYTIRYYEQLGAKFSPTILALRHLPIAATTSSPAATWLRVAGQEGVGLYKRQ